MKETKFKQTEVGLIPCDWNVKTVKCIAPLQRGFDLPTAMLRDGNVPVVYSNGICNFHNKSKCIGPGLVTGRSGTIGKFTFIASGPYWPHNTSLWVTSFKGNNPLFVYYLYSSLKIEDFSGGSGVPTLNRNNVHEKMVAVPSSIEEQKRIAKALSDVDSLIANLEKLIAKKKNIKQGAMQQLLTGRKRLPGFAPAKPTYKQTELGQIPTDWEMKKIGVFCKVYDGTHQTPHYVEFGIPFYSVENVSADDFEHTKFISNSEYECISKRASIEKGDVLMTRIGSIGVCKYVDWDCKSGFYVSLALLKCNEKIDARYLCQQSKSDIFKKEIELHSLTTAIPQKINLGPISQVRIIVPSSKKEQTAIANVLSDMDTEIATLETKLAKYRKLKTGMMQQLLTGKIRLV